MLHILLLLLKIIGIVLAVLLGIIILILCIVLFDPVMYQANAQCRNNIKSAEASVKLRWLFGLLRVNGQFKNSELIYSVQIAWKKILQNEEKESISDEIINQTKRESKKEFEEDEFDENAQNHDEIVREAVKETQKTAQKTKEKPELCETCEKTSNESEKELREIHESFPEKELEEDFNDLHDDFSQEASSIFSRVEKAYRKIKDIYQKIVASLLSIKEKVHCTEQNICDKIKELSEKKDHVVSFVKDPAHISAFHHVKKNGLRLLRKLKPNRFRIQLVYGFDDPSYTGKMLGVYSMLFPLLGNQVVVQPDFDDKRLEGEAYLRGKLRIAPFVIFAMKLLICKEIRMTYKDVRQFEL